ncbi:MAG: FKBP-type peptidyl-prolyl cis-trans isomerase [Bacteroidales bacterium]
MKRVLFFLLFLVTVCSCKKDKTDYTETDRQIILNYIAVHKLTALSTSSGLYYVVEKPGNENHPTSTSTVTINYTGKFTDGSIFDATAPGSPIVISLSSVIKGWQEGIPLFGKGGKGILLIPSSLGYGSTGSYGVPANSVLIFEIDLVDFH